MRTSTSLFCIVFAAMLCVSLSEEVQAELESDSNLSADKRARVSSSKESTHDKGSATKDIGTSKESYEASD